MSAYVCTMNNKIHPYALIIGLSVGILTLLILRHPLFGLFAGFCATLISDLVIKRGSGGGPKIE